ncbi:MAG: PP2C family protein-serine/threonine phosphatase [Silvibacterium sp.]
MSKPKGWMHFQSVPLLRLRVLLLAVFMLFSLWRLFSDLIAGGHDPYLVLASNMLFSGLISIVWVLVFARLSLFFIALPLLIQIAGSYAMNSSNRMLVREFALKSVDPAVGVRVCAITMMAVIVISYVFFITFIRFEGKESFKLRNELELAHGIQQTLVPPFTLQTARFEIYGISKPSEKVGGDLVDALSLPNGDAIAYLADIAGHGLQAGILMGMLKTATRTALLDAGEQKPACTLPVLLDRLNTVLPAVKESHMYATFSGFRLCADGTVFYALAASPPVLQSHASGLALSKVEEEQFPLGLLPVSGFDGQRLEMACGDLLVVATDGILEVCDKREEEFDVERLEQVIDAHAGAALPELAAKILETARGFGKQIDDQTILLVRCL